MTRADEIIKALRSGQDDLAAMVRDFTAEDLARTSGAAEWDVSQVLSHLGSGAEINRAVLEGALAGTGAPESGFNQGVWARWDAMSREERAEGFLDTSDALVRRYEGLDADTRENLRIDLGFMPAPVDVAAAGGLRLTEFALHVWDVKVTFDPKATLAPEATPLLLDLVKALLGFLGKPAEMGGPRNVAVHTTAPDRSFGLLIGDAMSIGETPADPDAVLTAPAEWWLRLVSGRHAPEHMPAGITITGDTVTLDDLRRVFPGF